MKLVKTQDQAFMSCQKIKILTIMKTGNTKDEAFQKGEMVLFLDQNHISTLIVGDTVDMCAYFTAEPFLTRVSG